MPSFSVRPFSSVIVSIALGVALATTLHAAPKPKLKLGTLAPRGTSAYKSLMVMGDQWRQASAGAVDLTIYAGGVQGGEADMVGMMKLGSLQAALVTAVGLAEIEAGVAGLQDIPMSFRSFEEVDYVLGRLRPLLEERMEAKGFVVLFWTDAGWVRFFSNQPVQHPSDFRKLKLFTWQGNPVQVDLYKSAGFNAVPLETADIVPSIQRKLIDVVPAPPFFAMAAQIDMHAPYMLELNWAPLVGALIVRKDTWEKIPAETRVAMLEAAAVAGREIRSASHREMTESVAAMEKRGLKVTKATPEIEAEFRTTAESVYPQIRGGLVPADIFDLAMKSLAEFRAAPKP